MTSQHKTTRNNYIIEVYYLQSLEKLLPVDKLRRESYTTLKDAPSMTGW